jgi:endonuclease/exonuclease/phosphatase family metal-dependent hydrolase
VKLTVVTWNIHACVGTDRSYDPARTADVLASLDADVIALQEVDWRRPRHGGLDQFEVIADRLGMRAIEGPNLEDHEGRYGNGLLTRCDVRSVDRLELCHGRREPRGAIDARLGCGDWTLRVVVTHLGLKRGERCWQARRLADGLEGDGYDEGEPRVLLGDLNEWWPWTGRVLGRLDDYFGTVVAPRTWPSRFPLLRLDRAMLGGPIECEESGAVRTRLARRASDHLPVRLRVSFTDYVAGARVGGAG